jgi:hypothetical protein
MLLYSTEWTGIHINRHRDIVLSYMDSFRRKNRSTGTRMLQRVGPVVCGLAGVLFRLLLFEVSIALALVQVFYLSVELYFVTLVRHRNRTYSAVSMLN